MRSGGEGGGGGIEIRPVSGGCELRLRVRTKAAAEAIVGSHGGALKLAVREVPERGRANGAVCALLGRILGVPASSVRIVRGATSHDKTARIDGLGLEECRRRLAERLDEA